VIACSFVEMHVTLIIVYLNVLDLDYKYYSCIINTDKILKVSIYFSRCFRMSQSNSL
jgi:hypothetical protein